MKKPDAWVLYEGERKNDPYWDRTLWLEEWAAIEKMKEAEAYKPKNAKIVIKPVCLVSPERLQELEDTEAELKKLKNDKAQKGNETHRRRNTSSTRTQHG